MNEIIHGDIELVRYLLKYKKNKSYKKIVDNLLILSNQYTNPEDFCCLASLMMEKEQ
jgi:hypothetical protein